MIRLKKKIDQKKRGHKTTWFCSSKSHFKNVHHNIKLQISVNNPQSVILYIKQENYFILSKRRGRGIRNDNNTKLPLI